jgi:hypothetical protein
MLPSYLGRWTTRLLLFVVFGIPITFFWSWWLGGSINNLSQTPWLVIVTLLGLGLILDPLYMVLQRFRWDRDWPFVFQFIAMIAEFVILMFLVSWNFIPWLRPNVIASSTDFWNVVIHFTLVFIPSFISLLGFLQIFLVRWRFKAGELGRL